MNERIKELIDSSYISVLTTKGMENVVDGCYIVPPDRLDKFAELIIKSCATVGDFAHRGGVVEPGVMIKEYFGVE